MSLSERVDRRGLLRWLDQSVMGATTEDLRFIACVAAIRIMTEDELDKLRDRIERGRKSEKGPCEDEA